MSERRRQDKKKFIITSTKQNDITQTRISTEGTKSSQHNDIAYLSNISTVQEYITPVLHNVQLPSHDHYILRYSEEETKNACEHIAASEIVIVSHVGRLNSRSNMTDILLQTRQYRDKGICFSPMPSK